MCVMCVLSSQVRVKGTSPARVLSSSDLSARRCPEASEAASMSCRVVWMARWCGWDIIVSSTWMRKLQLMWGVTCILGGTYDCLICMFC